MREERLPRVHRVAAARGADRQTLVGRDVLDEPQQLGSERRLWQRLRPFPADARRHLHHVVRAQALERPFVPDVDLVHGTVPGGE